LKAVEAIAVQQEYHPNYSRRDVDTMRSTRSRRR